MLRTGVTALGLALREQGTWVGDGTGDRRRRRGEGTRQQCPTARTLTTLEVAIARRDGKLPGSQGIAIHRDAHRAAGLAPLRARLDENAVQPLRLGGARHRV